MLFRFRVSSFVAYDVYEDVSISVLCGMYQMHQKKGKKKKKKKKDTHISPISETPHEFPVPLILQHALAQQVVHHVRVHFFMVLWVFGAEFGVQGVRGGGESGEEGGNVRGCGDVDYQGCLYTHNISTHFLYNP